MHLAFLFQCELFGSLFGDVVVVVGQGIAVANIAAFVSIVPLSVKLFLVGFPFEHVVVCSVDEEIKLRFLRLMHHTLTHFDLGRRRSQ